MEARILLIYTGGTIGMVQDESGSLEPFDFDQLLIQIPELRLFHYTIESYAFHRPFDSANLTPEYWIEMAEILEKNYHSYDGFVILHGSDTMAYTASMLSFLLENIAKPVILTGSQIPVGSIRTDAKEHLITAIEIAAAKDETGPLVPEVAVYFDYQLLRGNRSTKHNAAKFEAFLSPNYPPLAEAGTEIDYYNSAIAIPNDQELRVHKNISTKIASLKLYPGISLELVKAVCSLKYIKALVIETYGSGNANTNPDFIAHLQLCIDRGVSVFNITQCTGGTVLQGKYKTSVPLKQIGVVGGKDMTYEAAMCKLMFLLGEGFEGRELESQFITNLRGEINS